MKRTRFNWSRFLKWLFSRVVFPLLPIVIYLLAELFFRFGTFKFPDESILVFAFLLPVIYMQEIKDPNARNALYLVSTLCLALLVFAVIAKQPPNVQSYPDALSSIYMAGGIVFAVELLSATVFEIIRSFETVSDKP